MPRKRTECFRLILEHLAWIEFLSGIRDSTKVGSLLGMMRDVGRVRKSIHQGWLAKGLELGLLCWGSSGRDSLWRGQCSSSRVSKPVHNSILVTDYLTKMGIKTVPQLPYNPDLAPRNFWLFAKLRGCRYETIDEMKEAITKVIDILTKEGPAKSCWNGTSALQPEEITSKGTRVSCVNYQ